MKHGSQWFSKWDSESPRGPWVGSRLIPRKLDICLFVFFFVCLSFFLGQYNMISQIPANRGLWPDLWQDFEAFCSKTKRCSFSGLRKWGVTTSDAQVTHRECHSPQIKTITWRQIKDMQSEEKLARWSNKAQFTLKKKFNTKHIAY